MQSAIQTIYNSSPVLLQNLAISLYGLRLHRREFGFEFEKTLEEFEKRQWCTPSELEAYQNESLSLLIKHCYTNVPYYRRVMTDLKLTPDDIKTVQDLPKLPVLTRDTLIKSFDELQARNTNKADRISGSTSGTSGTSLQLLYDRRACVVKNVVEWRLKSSAGITPKSKIAYFQGRTIVPETTKTPPYWRHDWARNDLYFSLFHMARESLDSYCTRLERFQPEAIDGYPQTIQLLAFHLLKKNRTIPVKAVFTSSEMLYQHQRDAIEKAFECKIFDFYGMAERVIFATECESHNGMHLNLDYGITEFADQNSASAFSAGTKTIIATGLHNFTLPLLRYQTSDSSTISEKTCDCGRGFPLLDDMVGRSTDLIITRDGRFMDESTLYPPFKKVKTIEASQIIQTAIDHVLVRLVTGAGYSEADGDYLREDLSNRFGEGTEVELEIVNNLTPGNSGKFRWIESKVELDL